MPRMTGAKHIQVGIYIKMRTQGDLHAVTGMKGPKFSLGPLFVNSQSQCTHAGHEILNVRYFQYSQY